MSLKLYENAEGKSLGSLWDQGNYLDHFFQPFHSLQRLSELSNHMMRGMDGGFIDRGFNVHENETEYTYEVEVPGIDKDVIKVDEKDGLITISGERKLTKQDEKDGYKYVGTEYGSFKRSFRVPKNGDRQNMKGKYENGVLYITIPKTENDVGTNRLTIE